MTRSLAFVLTVLVVVSLGGCSSPASYKLLSFFFDGVPNPVEKKAVTAGVHESGEANAAAQPQGGSLHGPYAARMCYGCHDPGSNALLLPVQKLCFKCHLFKMNKKYIHGPLVSGGCIVCHDPHSSPNKFLLVARRQAFCLYCHEKKDIARNPAHKGIDMTQCISCHDGHMSNKRYLLK